MRLSLAVLLALSAVGAGESSGERPTRPPGSVGERRVEELRKKSGLKLAPCEDRACLDAAWALCRPSHLSESHFTVEGAPSFVDSFVLPFADGCRVVQLVDSSDDYWAGCKLVKKTCPSVAAATGNDPEDKGCGKPEVLFERRPCAMPMERVFQHAENPQNLEAPKAGQEVFGGKEPASWVLRDASFQSMAIRAVGGLKQGPRVVLASQNGAQARLRVGDFVARERYRFERTELIVGGICCIFEAAGAQARLCQRGALGDFPVPEREPPLHRIP
jgi:hypothetical protein